MNFKFYTTLILSFLIASQLFGQEQHPNSSFEDWSTITTGLVEPDGFVTTNVIPFIGATLPAGPYAEETTDAVDGASALKLMAKTDTSDIFVISGVYELPNVTTEPKPYTDRPDFLGGSHKGTMAAETDTAVVTILFRNSGTVIGLTEARFAGTSATYTSFESPIVWLDETTFPDSVYIEISISGENDGQFPTIGSEYFLDGLNFSTLSGILSPIMPEVNVSIYPNPTTDVVHFEMAADKVEDMVSLDIYDVNGKMIKSVPVNSNITKIDVSNFTNGFYYYQLRGTKGFVANGGKFSVAH